VAAVTVGNTVTLYENREENRLLVQTLQTSVALMAQEFDAILDRTKRVDDVEKQLLELKDIAMELIEDSNEEAGLDGTPNLTKFFHRGR